jgi:hypothetical protein
MGSSFYSGWLIPRETSLVIWGFEGKGSRVQGSKVKISFPFTDYCQEDSQREGIPLKGHLFARQGKNKTKRVQAVVSTS